MKTFQGIQKTFSFIQVNNGNIDQVFPLLCPVREKDWLDGWDFQMIYSNSGLIEKDCVFTTPGSGKHDTVWQVTQYDRENYFIEFVRVAPTENIVKINIQLETIDESLTHTHINYQYTGLNEAQNSSIENEMEQSFTESMIWWEKSIYHYLSTGEMLVKQP